MVGLRKIQFYEVSFLEVTFEKNQRGVVPLGKKCILIYSRDLVEGFSDNVSLLRRIEIHIQEFVNMY